jgi:hypothetical protein
LGYGDADTISARAAAVTSSLSDLNLQADSRRSYLQEQLQAQEKIENLVLSNFQMF